MYKRRLKCLTDSEFMPSQNLCTFKDNPIVNGQEGKKCCHGDSANSSTICNLVSEITSKKNKKIRLNIEIINDSD